MSKLMDELYEWDTNRVVQWLREVSLICFELCIYKSQTRIEQSSTNRKLF